MNQAIDESVEGISISGRTIKDLLFAYDIAMFTTTSTDLTEAANTLHRVPGDYGMEISTEKTKVLSFQNPGDDISI